MPTSRLSTVFKELRQAVLRHDGAGLTDGRLLETFISQNDEAAFEALVRRHGRMVTECAAEFFETIKTSKTPFSRFFSFLSVKHGPSSPGTWSAIGFTALLIKQR